MENTDKTEKEILEEYKKLDGKMGHSCPYCGRCPNCGRPYGNWDVPHPYYPYRLPVTY